MNRQIKFRGLHKVTNEWVYGDLEHLPNGNIHIFGNHYSQPVIESSVGQFTGLADRNGKDIYEGDILYNQDSPENHAYREVVFQRGSFCLRDWYSTTPIANHNIKAWEVVGNIHDNLDLVEIVNGRAKGGAQ